MIAEARTPSDPAAETEAIPNQQSTGILPSGRDAKNLQTLGEISGIVAADWDVKQIFPTLSARLRRLLHQEYASYVLHDPSTGLLVRQAFDFPLSKGLLGSTAVSAHNSTLGHAFQMGTSVIYSKSELQSFETDSARQFLLEGIQSLCCVPLHRPSGPFGMLVLGSTRSQAFHPEDLVLLNQVASQLALAIENHRYAEEIACLHDRLADERKYLEAEVRPIGQFDEIVGDSPALRTVLDQVAIVAPSDATALILGETGTGKELVARAIHRLSRRHDRNFVKLNCAAIPTGLLESELFGHEKGAFTGAVARKMGRMELADGGTLFLDEIGEIPLEVQPKLLRILQDQEFERLGSTRTLKVNVRVIAATNRDLARSVSERQFRHDLFYRINVFPIRLPALRERREDIPFLVRHFVRQFAARMGRHIETIPSETMKALTDWSWPGNVRELENLMERSLILSEGPTLRVPLLELHDPASAPVEPRDHTLDRAERDHILRALQETGGVLSGPDGAAKRLGLKRTTLQSKMTRLGITRYGAVKPKR
jgi:formate hydrogenlyase transcriptional activator